MIVGKLVRVFKDTYNTLAGYCDIDSVRTALEAYEQSKWVKFDEEDESTYPEKDSEVLLQIGYSFIVGWLYVDDNQTDRIWVCSESRNEITDLSKVSRWQYLPEFKE